MYVVQFMVSTNNDGVDGFYIYYRPYSSSRTVEYRRRTAPAGSRSNYVMLTGLVPDTAYSIRMAAYNRFGISDFSNTAVQKTLGIIRMFVLFLLILLIYWINHQNFKQVFLLI